MMHSKQPKVVGLSRRGVDTHLYYVSSVILFSLMPATASHANNGKLRLLEQGLLELSNIIIKCYMSVSHYI